MGDALRKRIRQTKFESPLHESLLNLLVAGGHVREQFEKMAAEFGITHPQYNVLRILRGGQPNGYSRSEIADRMLERAPDVTRLIDRLEQQELVVRDRSDEDRRLSITRITEKGLNLLDRIQPELHKAHSYFAGKISEADQILLSRICEDLYGDR
ncbi:MAG: MarR family transcriptional regulator [Candidatus Kapaibacterium sp.]